MGKALHHTCPKGCGKSFRTDSLKRHLPNCIGPLICQYCGRQDIKLLTAFKNHEEACNPARSPSTESKLEEHKT
jgi:hypothetical protein